MSEPIAVRVPQMNANDEQAIVVRWHVEKGARVRAGQTLVTLETTKATFDVDAPEDGYAFFEHDANTEVDVGSAVAWISPSAELRLRPAPAPVEIDESAPRQGPRFTRKALKLMRDNGLTERDFPGDARVDADAVARVAAASRRTAADADIERLELTPSKLLEIKALGRTYEQLVPSMVAVEVDGAKVEQRLRALAEQHGSVTLLELCIHEVAGLLPRWPELNAFYADRVAWTYRAAAIGFAVNLGHGLKVPVVRGAARLSLREIAVSVRDLTLRYMRDELTVDDLTGGTFTITDLSNEGVVHFAPVVNERQGAILGIAAQRAGTRARELVLAFDHRLADGMGAARFLGALRERLEQPVE